jgi:rhodanese-related sulfurtransferase
MDHPDDILRRARQRAVERNLPYAGALTPAEAHELSRHGAHLVDIRTRAEWEWVGRPKEALFIEWNTWPGGARNPAFADELKAAIPPSDAPVMFLCRSGGRSHSAAALAAQLGYTQAFNVLEGFEGDKDAEGHRGTLGGWRKAGLPWTQG